MDRDLLARAIEARRPMLGAENDQAVRLLNGFLEGEPNVVVDLYGRTVVVHDHSEAGDENSARAAVDVVAKAIPSVRAAVWKVRKALDPEARHGKIVLGTEKELDRSIREAGVRYAVDLASHADSGFYLDTRELRAWAKANLAGMRVLNTFAHTGSLGVAARAAGAEVTHVDRSKPALEDARRSYQLNGWEIERRHFVCEDFFRMTARLRKEDTLFDCVLLDPPFFSTTGAGRVDLEQSSANLINKVRPLVGDGGSLAIVNNALFVSGAEHMKVLEDACKDGFLSVETILGVPEDSRGYDSTRTGSPPADPAPFQHSTKIAILRVKRKDGRSGPP
jgi:23S rRNA (cytosine1962-C5)-methyltransferase